MSRPDNLLRFDFLKSSRVQFSIDNLPGIFPASYKRTVSLRDMAYMCESLEFPGKNLTTAEFKQAGYNRAKVPILRNYSEINLTFLLPDDRRLPLYNLFADWIEFAAPRDHVVAYYDDIALREGIYLTQYTEINKDDRVKLKLINSYPLAISPIQGNWGDNEFSKIMVSLAFEDFKFADPVARTTIPALENPNDPLSRRPLVRPGERYA